MSSIIDIVYIMISEISNYLYRYINETCVWYDNCSISGHPAQVGHCQAAGQVESSNTRVEMHIPE